MTIFGVMDFFCVDILGVISKLDNFCGLFKKMVFGSVFFFFFFAEPPLPGYLPVLCGA